MPNPEQGGRKPEETPKEEGELKENPKQAEVNGIKISVGWDKGYEDYTIYLPQIELGSGQAEEYKVPDQVLRLSKEDEEAEKVFDFATKKAKEVDNAYELYKEVKEFRNEKIL